MGHQKLDIGNMLNMESKHNIVFAESIIITMARLYLTIGLGGCIVNGNVRSVFCPFCGTSTNRELARTHTPLLRKFRVSIFWCEHCHAIAAINNRIEPIKNDDLAKKYPSVSLIPGKKYYFARLLYIREFAVPYFIRTGYGLKLSTSAEEYIKFDIRHYVHFNRPEQKSVNSEQKHSKSITNVTLFDAKYGLCTFVEVNSKNLSNPSTPYPEAIDFFRLNGNVFLSFGEKNDIGSVSFANSQMPWYTS